VLDDVEFGIFLVQEGFALRLDGALFVGGGVGVSIVELLDDLHAVLIDGGEGSEALLIEKRIVIEADEDLRGARVGTSSGESNVAALVAFQDGIILDGGVEPSSGNRGIGADAELDDKVGNDTKNDHVVVEMVADEIVEAVDAVGSPGARDVHDEVAARGFKFDLEGFGSLLLEESGLQKRAVIFGSGGFGLRGSGSLRG